MADLSRDLGGARDAYTKGDIEASKVAHGAHKKEPHQGRASDYVQAIVFGGLDGIVTTFAVVAAAAATKLTYGTILIIGFANLLADAMGMAVGDFLSSRAESDHEKAERAREEWEIEHVPEKEKQEMVDIYKDKGIPEEDAKEVVNLLWPYKECFLDVMMIEELGMMPESHAMSEWTSALITFGAFMIFGGAPMLPYLFSIDYKRKAGLDKIFWIAIGIFSISLFSLGAVKGRLTGKRWYVHGLIMLITGGVTTLIAWASGHFLEKWTNKKN